MPAPDNKIGNLVYWLKDTIASPNDSIRKTLFVATALCLVCSVVVASAAVLLKPMQQRNQTLDYRRNVLEVAGMYQPGIDVDTVFSTIDVRMVDLVSGEYTDQVPLQGFSEVAAAQDPTLSQPLGNAEDIARIGRKANYARVYLVRDETDAIETLILPVRGYGLWGTMYGFLAMAPDARTITGLKFYQHQETPGLGGEIDNPQWLEVWDGKLAYDDTGELRIEVIKGNVTGDTANAEYKVDGLAGATLTSRGVHNLVRFWLSDAGFEPYLDRIRQQQG